MKKTYALWLMGPTASGKTTLAEALHKKLNSNNIPIIHYDGDEIRDLFGASHGFKEEDRLRVVKALVHFSNKSMQCGLNVIVSALTANNDARDYIRENVKNLIVGYIKCNIGVCIRRDPKGIYKKAMNGAVDTVIGYNVEYQTPSYYDFLVDTEKHTINQCIELIEQHLLLEKH